MMTRKIFPWAITVLALSMLSGCVSLTADDPRNPNRHELWWLGAKNPDQMTWPARTVEELPPMPVESLPDRSRTPATTSPNWPPL